MGHPTCIIEGLACWLTLCILEKIICNSTNSVQISFIETLKLIVFSWTIWWCYWQNVMMINEKNNFLTVSWLSGVLSAEIFISTGEWGVQMPPLTSENSYFLRSGPQGATLVMNGKDWNPAIPLVKRIFLVPDYIWPKTIKGQPALTHVIRNYVLLLVVPPLCLWWVTHIVTKALRLKILPGQQLPLFPNPPTLINPNTETKPYAAIICQPEERE